MTHTDPHRPAAEHFTPGEREALAPHFTNLDGPVFALVNLPEVVKGALFARYSRSPKSLRRLFLDEFRDDASANPAAATGTGRSEALFDRVFVEYGDDSVAQLGGVHLACEGVSNLLTKVLEWGRLMSYLEQSTRYIAYTDRPGGRWKYHVPRELEPHPDLLARFESALDLAFATYASMLEPMRAHLRARFPRPSDVGETAYARAIAARALDVARGLLPAATRSNVGIYGSPQAYESLLLHLRAHPLQEARDYGTAMLAELRRVVPSFMKRVDRPDRGLVWSRYLESTGQAVAAVAAELLPIDAPVRRPEVRLVDYDPDGEVKVVAAALFAASGLDEKRLLEEARAMTPEQRQRVLDAYVGDRSNRRHKPGRAFERTSYRFEVVSDYGAFRDLQRHRLLTIEWQPLSPAHGYAVPAEVENAGLARDWHRVMGEAADTFAAIEDRGLVEAARYAVSMAYRLRYVMQMNAREAFHVLELRTSPQGHPSYRRVCQHMHRLIAEGAGHASIAAAMRFVDHSTVDLERLDAEAAAESRRAPGPGA